MGRDCTGSDERIADSNDRFSVGHRFVAHGNRNWRSESEEFDLSVGVVGRLNERLGYDVRVEANRFDGFVNGDTFVHEGRAKRAIEGFGTGDDLHKYDLENPFSDAPEHQRAVAYSSLRLERDIESESLSTRWALEGSGFAIGGRKSAWSAGVELGRYEAHNIRLYRANDDSTYDVSHVLGSGGANFAGKRSTTAAFAEMSLPLAENLDLRAAGRGVEYNDIGRLDSRLLAAEYRPTDNVALRGSWATAQGSPSMLDLYSIALQDHPYILCDPGAGEPESRSCPVPLPRQVTRVTRGSPDLDPSDSKRLSAGVEARKGPYFLGVEWYRLSSSGLSQQRTATWAMLNLPNCAEGDGEKSDCIERDGGDITIHQGFANILGANVSGINTRFGGGFRTNWGVVGMRGAWRRVTSAELLYAGERERYVIARDAVRVGFLARRGNVSVTWTANYRSGFSNQTGTGTYESWTGHDLVLDWTSPLGLEDARVTGGVFNLTDTGLTADTANPGYTDGPTAAGWGRTYFLTLNLQF